MSMASRQISDEPAPRRRRPATTPEEQENRNISLAVKLAEKQMRDGSASTPVITHYLKLATTRERLEQEKLARENELLRARSEALASQANMEELMTKAIQSFSRYQGDLVDEQEQD